MTDEEKKELFIQETVKDLVLSEFQEKLLRKILDSAEKPILYSSTKPNPKNSRRYSRRST